MKRVAEIESRATGTVVWEPATSRRPGFYKYRLNLEDGSRPWIKTDVTTRSPLAEARVREKAAEEQRKARQLGLRAEDFDLKPRSPKPAASTPAVTIAAATTTSTKGAGLTVSDWFGKYYDHAEAGTVGRKNAGRGQVSAGDRRKRFEHWIEPVIGSLPMATVGPDDLRRVVKKMDEAIRERVVDYEMTTTEERRARGGRKPGITAKFGKHLWGELTSAFRESCTSKQDELRVRSDDPTRLVQPPTGGDSREQTALYPSEVDALLGAPAEKVPTYRKAAYAVGAYSGLRVGELRGLTPEDVDLDHDVINVRRQAKAGKGSARTKTRAGRRQVPIEPALRPLLEILVEQAEKGAPLLRIPPAEDCAEKVRLDLVAAGCDREELFADDAERMPFNFHGLRHTALTHWAVAGRSVPWLLSAAGHTNVAMTTRYVDGAAVLRATFGQPHPPLPKSLLDEVRKNGLGERGRRASTVRSAVRTVRTPNSVIITATPTGIEPVLPT